MVWQFNIYAYSMLATAIFAFVVAIAAWRRRPKIGATSLGLLMTALSWWAVFSALETAAVDVPGKVFWSQWAYVGIVAVPTLWFVFTLQYTDLIGKWLSPARRLGLLVMPLVTLLLVFTNARHGLIWQKVEIVMWGDLLKWNATYGLGFVFHTAYSYALMFFGLVIMTWAMIRSPWPYQAQAFVLLIGSLIPWLSNAISITGIVELPVDVTPYAFTVAGGVIFWGLFKFRLLDLTPLVRDAVVNSISDAMVVVNPDRQIIDINPAALEIIGLSRAEVLGHMLPELMPQYQALFILYQEKLEARDEVPLVIEGQEKWFDLQISPLYGGRQQLRGRLVVLRDITARKVLEASLETQAYRIFQLLDVARATSKSPTLNSTMVNVLTMARTITDSDAGSLILVNEQGKVMHKMLTRGFAVPEIQEADLSYVLEEGLISLVLRQRMMVVIEDAATDSRWVHLPDQPFKVGSVLGVPIQYGNKLLGGLTMVHAHAGHFNEDNVDILEAAASQMALALENALNYEEQRRMAEQQTILFETLNALQHPMSLKRSIVQSTQVIAQLAKWPVVAILTTDEDGQLRLDAADGRLAQEIFDITFDDCEAAVPDAIKERPSQRFNSEQCVLSAIPANILPSVLLIPLQGEATRFLLVASDEPFTFNGDERLLANSLGDVVALVLRDAQLYEIVNTERQRLAALVQANRDGIIMIGNDNQILVMGQMAIRYLGLPGKAEDWVYRSILDALRPLRPHAHEAVEATLKEMQRLRQGDTAVGEGEYQILGRYLHWFNLPVVEANLALGRLLILHDITEEHQVSQMREDLTRTMVHDLRNPLTGIHGALLLLQRHLKLSLPDAQQELLSIAQRSVGRLLDLVNAILDISRMESGRMPLSPSMFAMHDLVSDSLALQSPLAHQKEIVLQSVISVDLPPVWGDRDLIARVLQNLVGNAIKFTPQNGEIYLRGEILPDDPRKVRISVADTGSGIPPEIKDRLFEKFVAGPQSGRGSGLGLAFCKMVLEAHGESLWVESVFGEGTTFIFTLPVASWVMTEEGILGDD